MSDRLERLRDRAHNQMLQILQFAERISETTTREDITTRLEALRDRYQTFNELELQLFESDTYKSITDAVDDVYYKAHALLKKAQGHEQRTNNNTHDLNATLEEFIGQQKTFYDSVNTAQHAHLPKVNIEQFSGDYRSWTSFHDLFKTTVHTNQKISNVHKLQILRGLLSGEAAALIKHISITEANYTEAWDKLCARYNKRGPIVTSLLQTLFEQKPCAQATGNELRRISETADEVIRGLRVLGSEAETRDPWLIHIVLNKIDSESKQLWANEAVGKDFPKFETFLEFLNKRCDALEMCEATTKRVNARASTKSFVTANLNTTIECIACSQPHPLFRCPIFTNKNLDARLQLVTEANLCRNCLKKGHISAKCFSKFSCLICKKHHHTLLHPNQTEVQTDSSKTSASHHLSVTESSKSQSTANIEPPQNINQNNSQINDYQVLHTLYSSPTTVLPTAVVLAETRTGKLQPFRALLDSGSQSSFVTESCAQRLGLQRCQTSISIYGLASAAAGNTKGKIDMTIYSRVDKHFNLKVTAHIIHNITNLLPTKSIHMQEEIVGLELADPQFFKPNKIDILLGADVFFEILNPEKRVSDGSPVIQSSKFGWLVAGTWTNKPSNIVSLHTTNDPLIETNNEDLNQPLRNFWEVEEIAAPENPDMSSNSCEIYYEQTTIKTSDGQYIVKLPFKEPRLSLGSSFEAAHQRLLAMERKVAKLPEFSDAYHDFVKEYIDLGHMTYTPRHTIPANDDPADLNVLTPAHFLVGEPLTAVPEPSLEDIPSSKLSRWQNIRQRIHGFWKRWHYDYLTTLQQRCKWKTKGESFDVDNIVLVREDGLHPSQWMLGRIAALHPGTDGIVRVVTVKTAKMKLNVQLPS